MPCYEEEHHTQYSLCHANEETKEHLITRMVHVEYWKSHNKQSHHDKPGLMKIILQTGPWMKGASDHEQATEVPEVEGGNNDVKTQARRKVAQKNRNAP